MPYCPNIDSQIGKDASKTLSFGSLAFFIAFLTKNTPHTEYKNTKEVKK